MSNSLFAICFFPASAASEHCADGLAALWWSGEAVPWWVGPGLGLLWVFACLAGVFAVSAALLGWAHRQIRGHKTDNSENPANSTPTSKNFPQESPVHAIRQERYDSSVDLRILETLPQPVCWKDCNLVYLGCNKSAAEMMGLDGPEYIIGKTDADLFADRQQVDFLQNCDRRVIQTAMGAFCLLEHPGRDNERRRYQICKTPLLDTQGNVIGIVETADNYTNNINRPQPQESVKEAQESYRMAFEELVEGFALYKVMCDEQGKATDYRVLDINPAFAKGVGISRERVIGRLISELDADSTPADPVKFSALVRESTPSQYQWHCERTGKDFNVIAYNTSNNQITMLVIDDTARNRAEQESQDIQEQLHQSRKMEAIGQLAGGIAHDFNNLLTAIQGNAELIRVSPSSSTDHMECTDQILQASRRMADLTQQLLAFGRKGKLQTTTVDINEAILETVKLLTHSIDRRIEIVQELRAASSNVMGDPSQLKNMLLNLAINARDAMPKGGQIRFTTRTVRFEEKDCRQHPDKITPGEYLEITVSDTGTGMDEATIERIFEPFFTTKKIGEGTGLGLAGVYGCVKNHNGFIDVKSELNQGSTFNIFLPPAESNYGIYTSANDNKSVPDAKHILIVDDEVMVRNYASRALRTLGYRVSLCCDGKEAILFYRDNFMDIDLVILDLIMPQMGGEETFRQLKQINPNIRTLLASGFSDNETIETLRAEGVLGFLNKPFEIEELSKAVSFFVEEESQTTTQPPKNKFHS